MKLFISLLMLLLAACASDRPPSGGLAESAPLQVIFSNPAPESVNVATKSIHLTFSHEISARQLVGSLIFSPSVENYDLSVRGREAEITFNSPLESNATYRLTIDKNLRNNQGRSFTSPYALAFSTGPALDVGTITGTVLVENWEPAQNALVLAFADRPEFRNGKATLLTEEPDYIVQTNPAGKFTFNHIKAGSYRIFACNDKNSDLHYNYRTEETAQSSSEVVWSEKINGADLTLRLTGLQSNSGTLVSCRPINREQLEIIFARAMMTTAFNPENFEINHALSGTPVKITGWYSKNRTMSDREFILVTAPLKVHEAYLLREKANEKRTGISFYSSSLAPPKAQLSVTLQPDNRSNPAYLDRGWPAKGKAVILSFSHPVEKSAVSRAVTLAETSANGERPLHFSLTTIDSRTFALKPEIGFKPGISCTVTVNAGAIDGTPSKPVVSTFMPASKDDTGTLSGHCSAPGEYLIAEAKESGSAAVYRTVSQRDRNRMFRFTFTDLPPGGYTVSAFAVSGKTPPEPYRPWNPGSISPLQTAEPFGVHPGAVMVRAQWSTTDINITIKE